MRVLTDSWSLEFKRYETDRVTQKSRRVYEAVHESYQQRWEFEVPVGSVETTRWDVIHAFHVAQKERRRARWRSIPVRVVRFEDRASE